MPAGANLPSIGLRERKKQKTRAAIQQHALRLFQEQGYAATTVEQISEAAEVSPSTFFRYFSTKEDVVVRDAFEAAFLDAVKAQPADLSPIQAVRQTFHGFLSLLPSDQLDMERERLALIMATPELRARMFGEYPDALRKIANLISERKGWPAESYDAYLLSGALLGVGLAAMVAAADDPKSDYYALFDKGLARLDEGLPR